ncbi:hypothetical protein [Lacipirellula parvula]|uniref:Uncharacterized protein n=1 Tax=Lacipirellula parvula TaxID=2650471 RepID=A0A5K7XCB8_9BACT|nr:hypothetical protein [Lacipirellula parvula]BBO33602.1 hypothetical protein PLANPX_3214 [Lacipirellula parvula]
MRRCSHLLTFVLLLLATPTVAEELELRTTLLIDSPYFDDARVEQEIVQRIEAGLYEGYKVDLCIDDPSQCDCPLFDKYRQEGEETPILIIKTSEWAELPAPVRDAAIREIKYYTWGHPKRVDSPRDVLIAENPLRTSPLTLLSPHSGAAYLQFIGAQSRKGGLGENAYGPNCWYHAIAAIADSQSRYAQSRLLKPAEWSEPRFMGPVEFRHHMQHFVEVETPQFGDVIRYYTDEPIFDGSRGIANGEKHAAVYIGAESWLDKNGDRQTRPIALTKNGRNELSFLMFQDVAGLDSEYLKPPTSVSAPSTSVPLKRGFFRVKPRSDIQDPAASGEPAVAYDAYMVDTRNMADRWLFLAGLQKPANSGDRFGGFPKEWLTLDVGTTQCRVIATQ